MRIPASDEPQVFFVVGVPGSGKDTVLKRYIRALGLSLVDASADLVKEYLAAWGKDELSLEVRENNREHGPGKHLLHAQYLHRESILICDQIVERCIEQRKSLILEKTLFNLEPVLELARAASDGEASAFTCSGRTYSRRRTGAFSQHACRVARRLGGISRKSKRSLA